MSKNSKTGRTRITKGEVAVKAHAGVMSSNLSMVMGEAVLVTVDRSEVERFNRTTYDFTTSHPHIVPNRSAMTVEELTLFFAGMDAVFAFAGVVAASVPEDAAAVAGDAGSEAGEAVAGDAGSEAGEAVAGDAGEAVEEVALAA